MRAFAITSFLLWRIFQFPKTTALKPNQIPSCLVTQPLFLSLEKNYLSGTYYKSWSLITKKIWGKLNKLQTQTGLPLNLSSSHFYDIDNMHLASRGNRLRDRSQSPTACNNNNSPTDTCIVTHVSVN